MENVMKEKMKKLIKTQFFILLLGTIFAWGNFIWELVNYLQDKECATSCTVGLVNPFKTPCFFGAMFFLAAFVISAIMFKGIKKCCAGKCE